MFMTVLKADIESLSQKTIYVNYSDEQWMHQWLTSQFDKSRDEENILYKLDMQQDGIYLYIQSNDRFPEKNLAKAGFKLADSIELPAPDPNGRIEFRISCSAQKKRDNKPYFVQNEEDRIEWVKERLSPFMKDIFVVEKKRCSACVKREYRLQGADYEGFGTVTDPEMFMETVSRGIGKAKCYGFGLLMYQPA